MSSSPPSPTTPLTIVIKVGTSTIMDHETGYLSMSNLSHLVETVWALKKQLHRVVIVSSGAVGVGKRRLKEMGYKYKLHEKNNNGKRAKKDKLCARQAASAIGQSRLMHIYDDLFSKYDQIIAQVLLTRTDLSERSKYLNARNTFIELLEMDVIPIVNENDTVSIEELRFGDNDTLSALVAGMIGAHWLFLLTDVDCLYTSNPRTDPLAKPIHIVDDLDQLEVNVEGAGTNLGTGGMLTKITAATLATAAGCHTAISIGISPKKILKILAGEQIGTVFKKQKNPMGARKWWIQHSLQVSGTIEIDNGAVEALRKNKSLFAAGIKSVTGTFKQLKAVKIVSADTGEEIGRGVVNYSSSEISLIKGRNSSEIGDVLGFVSDETVIHRDNLLVFQPKQNNDQINNN
jgi:glutamate 5-kinase